MRLGLRHRLGNMQGAAANRFSLAARDYFNRLDAAGLRVTAYDAANARLIDRLVANGGNFWPDSGAFCAMAGYLFPTGEMPDAMVVEGAGTTAPEKIYLRNGEFNSLPRYDSDSYRIEATSDANNPVQPQDSRYLIYYIGAGGFPEPAEDPLYYYQSVETSSTSLPNSPDLATWESATDGTAPAPTVRRATWADIDAAGIDPGTVPTISGPSNLIPLHPDHDTGTLFNFVSGDWNAVTGNKGDGSTKYVDSNRNNNADGQNDQAMGVFLTSRAADGAGEIYMGSGVTQAGSNLLSKSLGDALNIRNRNSTSDTTTGLIPSTGCYLGATRSLAASYVARVAGANETFTVTSQVPFNSTLKVFKREDVVAIAVARIPFYHIGPNLNGAGELAEMDAALTEWQAALAAA